MSSEVKANKLSPATGTDVTLGDSGDTFTVPSGATIANSGTASGFGLFSAYAILREEQSSGTNGTSASGADTWDTRVLNTEAADPSSIVTLSSNQFTLGAGSYLIGWWCQAKAGGYWATRLYDVTGTAVCSNGYGSPENDGQTDRTRHSRGYVRVSPSGSNVYRIEANADTATAVWGQSASRGTEVYTEVLICKEA